MGSAEGGIVALGFLTAALFFWGCFRLGRRVSGHPLAGAVLVVASAGFVRDALIGEWGLEIVLPRSITMAAAPFLFEAFLCWGVRRSVVSRSSRSWDCSRMSTRSLPYTWSVFWASLSSLLRGRSEPGGRSCSAGSRAASPLPRSSCTSAAFRVAAPPELEVVAQSSFAYFIEPFFYKTLLIGCGFAVVCVPAFFGLWVGRGAERSPVLEATDPRTS